MDCSLPGSSVHGILQAPLSMGFSRQPWSGLPFSSPGDLSDPGIEPVSPALQADFFHLLSRQGSPRFCCIYILFCPFPVIWPSLQQSQGRKDRQIWALITSLSPYLQWESTIFQCSHNDQYGGFQVAESMPGILTRSNWQWDQVRFATSTPSSPCWGTGQHRWITVSKQQLNFSTCSLLFITRGTQLRTNKTCCVCVRFLAIPRTVACQAPLSVGSSRQEYWSELLCPPPWDVPDPGLEPRSPALRADSLPFEPRGKPEKPLLSRSHIYAASNAFRLLQVKNEHVHLVGFFFLFLVCLLCHTIS